MRPPTLTSLLAECALLLPPLAAAALLARLHPHLGQAPFLYAAYFAVFLLLPSLAFAKLLPMKDLGLAERAVLGFPVTLAAMFLLAWGGSRLAPGGWQAVFLLPAIGLYAVVDLFLKRGRLCRTEPFTLVATLLVLTLSLALCFDYFSLTPTFGEGTRRILHCDDAYMAAMTASVLKAMQDGGPLMECGYKGIPFIYHIQMHAANAVAHLITGIHPQLLQIYIYPIFHWAMLAGAVTVGARRLAGFGPVQTVFAVLLLLYSSGLVFESQQWMQMFGNFHTYFFGLPATVVVGMLIMGHLGGGLERLPVVYATGVFLAMCSAKGVPLLLVPLSLAPVLAYRLWKRLITRNDVLFLLGACATVGVLKLIEYTSTGQIVTRKFNLFNSVIPTFNTLLDFAPFLALLAALWCSRRLYAWKIAKSSQYILFVSTMYGISAVLTRLVDFVGGSQYFFWYTRVFFFILCAQLLPLAWKSHNRSLRVGVAAVLAASTLLFAYHRVDQHEKLAARHDESAPTSGEWEGLLWAHRNLDQRAAMICNGTYSFWLHNGVLHSVGIFEPLALSGLYGYATPYSWLPEAHREEAGARLKKTRLFFEAKSPEERDALLADMAVDYIFLCKSRRYAEGFALSPKHTRIYSNPEFEIYAVAKP